MIKFFINYNYLIILIINNMDSLIIFFIIILIIIILSIYKKREYQNDKIKVFNKKQKIFQLAKEKKPFIWIYYENPTNSRYWSSFHGRRNNLDIPAYMFLVFNSIQKNCSNFNFIILNKDNLKYFINDTNLDLNPNSKIPYILRLNFIKYYILYHYGGIWLDQCLVLKDLSYLYNRLENYDVIGFGCDDDEYRCTLNKMRPRDDVLFAIKESNLMRKCYNDIKIVTENYYNYPSFEFKNGGCQILWNNLDALAIEGKLSFYQFNSEYDGTRDYNNKIITAENLVSLNYTKFLNKKNLHFVIFDHKSLYKNFDYQWFLRLNIEQLMKSNMWFIYLYRESINYKNEYNSKIYNFSTNLPPTAKQYLYSIWNNNLFSNPFWYIFFNSSTRNS